MIAFFARHPTAANLFMIGFLVLGLFTLPNLRRDTFPRIQPTKVQISVAYPGSRAEDVEEAICRRIEDAIDAVNQVDRVSCEAREGLAQAVVEMQEGGDLDRFASDVKTEVDAITDFPERAEDPIIKQLGSDGFRCRGGGHRLSRCDRAEGVRRGDQSQDGPGPADHQS